MLLIINSLLDIFGIFAHSLDDTMIKVYMWSFLFSRIMLR